MKLLCSFFLTRKNQESQKTEVLSTGIKDSRSHRARPVFVSEFDGFRIPKNDMLSGWNLPHLDRGCENVFSRI
jgi:hypothetical protein